LNKTEEWKIYADLEFEGVIIKSNLEIEKILPYIKLAVPEYRKWESLQELPKKPSMFKMVFVYKDRYIDKKGKRIKAIYVFDGVEI